MGTRVFGAAGVRHVSVSATFNASRGPRGHLLNADRDGVESGLDHPSPHPRRVPRLSRKWRVFFPDDKFEQVRSALVGMRLSPL